MHFSNWMESGILTHFFRTATIAKRSTVAVGLSSNPVRDTDNGNTVREVANAGAYARVDLGAPADADWSTLNLDGPGGSGTMDNAAAITFPQATADWGNVSGVFLVDNATYGTGEILMYGDLATPRDVKNNDTFEIAASDLSLYVD